MVNPHESPLSQAFHGQNHQVLRRSAEGLAGHLFEFLEQELVGFRVMGDE